MPARISHNYQIVAAAAVALIVAPLLLAAPASADSEDSNARSVFDSGGPLLVKEDGAWGVAGILSGPEVGAPGIAGLYTDVRPHARWIQQVMANADSIPDDEVTTGMSGYPTLGLRGVRVPCGKISTERPGSTDDQWALRRRRRPGAGPPRTREIAP